MNKFHSKIKRVKKFWENLNLMEEAKGICLFIVLISVK